MGELLHRLFLKFPSLTESKVKILPCGAPGSSYILMRKWFAKIYEVSDLGCKHNNPKGSAAKFTLYLSQAIALFTKTIDGIMAISHLSISEGLTFIKVIDNVTSGEWMATAQCQR